MLLNTTDSTQRSQLDVVKVCIVSQMLIMLKMQEEVAKVEDFKYLGSIQQSNGREVKKRVQAGWNGVEKNVRSDLRQESEYQLE